MLIIDGSTYIIHLRGIKLFCFIQCPSHHLHLSSSLSFLINAWDLCLCLQMLKLIFQPGGGINGRVEDVLKDDGIFIIGAFEFKYKGKILEMMTLNKSRIFC